MTVQQSIQLLSNSGAQISVTGDRIRVVLPEDAPETAEVAMEVIREHKAEAIDLLSREQLAEALEEVLKGQAVELWSDLAGERLFIVADEEDAAKLDEPRGTIYTAAEVRMIVSIRDPNVVAEIHNWKRTFMGRLRECRVAAKREQEGLP